MRARRLFGMLVLQGLAFQAAGAVEGYQGNVADPVTILTPREGLGQISLEADKFRVAEVLGDPERKTSEGIWEYPSRCLLVTFMDDGRIAMLALSGERSKSPEKLTSECGAIRLAGGHALGASIEEVRRTYPNATPRITRTPGDTSLQDKDLRLTLRFQDGRLVFASVSPPAKP